jgi:serine/threonine protein kinase
MFPSSGSSQRLRIEKGSHLPDVDEAQLPLVPKRILGQGGCSVVEEVQDRNSGRLYARKVFLPKWKDRARIKDIFENELKIIRCVEEHHYMVAVHATYTTAERLGMLLLPVADGGDLDNYLGHFLSYQNDPTRHKALLDEMTSNLQRAYGCLAAGLKFIHKSRIRHKDIKPSNILVHRGLVLYTDFGLAFDSRLLENSMTDGPTNMTRRYAAPEVLSSGTKNSSSDVYSLGCVFIQMYSVMSRSLSYNDEETFSDLMDRIHTQLQEKIQTSKEELIAELILLMTSRDTSQRWTAHEVWTSLSMDSSCRCDACYQDELQTVRADHDLGGISGMGGPGPVGTVESAAAYETFVDTTSHFRSKSGKAPVGATRYTAWEWAESYGCHYCYLMDSANQILETLWSGPSQPITTSASAAPSHEPSPNSRNLNRSHYAELWTRLSCLIQES